MNNKMVILVLLAACFVYRGNAQQPGSYEQTEIARISQVYRPDAYLSFKVTIHYADSASPAVSKEQMTGEYQLHREFFRYVLDSTEILQGEQYNLVVYHDDGIITVNKAQQYPDLLKMPTLFDTTYMRLHISRFSVSDPSDTVRVMTIAFLPGEPYVQYELQYDPRTYLLRRVSYYLHDLPSDEMKDGSGTSLVTLEYTQYSRAIINESSFRESRFVLKEDNTFYAQAPYAHYQVISNLSDEE